MSAFISPLERNEDPSAVLVPTLTAVPDSCCLRPERAESGCGKKAFKDDDDNQAIRPQDTRIRQVYLNCNPISKNFTPFIIQLIRRTLSPKMNQNMEYST